MSTTAFCFDFDGTVTKQELLPIIAREVGLEDEIGVLTRATMQGLLPFDKSFKLRCKLLESIPISSVHSILRELRFHEEIEKFIKKNRENCFIISGNLDVWIDPLIKQLGCRGFTSRARYSGDFISGVEKVLDKSEAIDSLRSKYKKIVAIGESFNDVPMFETADVRIAFGGTHQPVSDIVILSDFVVYSEGALCQLLKML